MIEDNGLVFTNLNGQRWVANNNTWALKESNPEPSFKSTPIERSQEPGEFPTRTHPGALMLHYGGDLICDTVENYMVQYLTAVNVWVPAGIIERERKMGVISIKYYGQEWLDGDCTVDGYGFPMQALYPTVTEFTVSFKVFAGYMIGRISGRPISL